MLSTVLRTIATHALCARGDRVIVAVSGGPDSMALLHLLWEARERLGVELVVAGVDHGLRPAAAEELALVRARAEALGLPFARLWVDVAGGKRGPSWQDAARRARLAVLEALAVERRAQRIALGHQADDQAETVLFRIVRGTGLAGLAGIPYRRGPFIRPLLDVRRAEVLRYLRRRSIPFVDDPSNADPRYARARVRHRLLPLLAEENPRVVEALVALAAAARAPGPRDELTATLPLRVRAAVGRLRARGGTAAVDLAGGRRVEISYGQARIVRIVQTVRTGRTGRTGTGPADRAPGRPEALTIAGPGAYRWAAGRLDVKEAGAAARRPDGTVTAEFDADRLDWPLAVRERRAGDRMRPRGGRGSRKLSDLMIDAKITRAARAALPVVTSARGELLFVPGLRPAEIARPDEHTRRVVRLRFQREN
ncbi:MAG TPA: tRNA lysidine(34) synthetase TilS [Polyangia bacterium]|jgi:tRNA(Ile)-lysidine synthase